MKTTKINEYVTEEVCEYCEQYTVIINNETKKVKKFHCRFMKRDKKGIQEMVDRLIEKGMIVFFGNDSTEVYINIWDIDETNQLYIETYHKNPEFSEYISCENHKMLYDEFLN